MLSSYKLGVRTKIQCHFIKISMLRFFSPYRRFGLRPKTCTGLVIVLKSSDDFSLSCSHCQDEKRCLWGLLGGPENREHTTLGKHLGLVRSIHVTATTTCKPCSTGSDAFLFSKGTRHACCTLTYMQEDTHTCNKTSRCLPAILLRGSCTGWDDRRTWGTQLPFLLWRCLQLDLLSWILQPSKQTFHFTMI